LEALIRTYGQAGLFEQASHVFEMIEGPADSSCLRAMLLACSTAKPRPRWEKAISILHSSDITAGATGPGGVDQGALSNAILACSRADRWEESWNLLNLYGADVSSRESHFTASLSVVALNALIAACGRKGRPDVAVHIINTMETQYGVKPDERSYRSAVIACNQAEHERRRHRHNNNSNNNLDGLSPLQWWECSLALLRRMQESGLKPDIQTFSSCISACEAAGQWQRALGVLQAMIDGEDSEGKEETILNLFCFNAAVSACEKGGAWVEALEIYERMIIYGGSLTPNFVTLSSLVLALFMAGQKELAQSKYEEAQKMKIVNPWRFTKDSKGAQVQAMVRRVVCVFMMMSSAFPLIASGVNLCLGVVSTGSSSV
jgi:pentatricopeptide repeat domain-containing protein 1